MAAPPPLSFGTTSAPAASPPPLKFTEPAPTSAYTPPPPLSFGATPSPYPFNDFAHAALGNVKTKLGPTDTPLAGGMFDNKTNEITVSSKNPLNLGAEQFNALYKKQQINPTSFNAAWDTAKSKGQDTDGTMGHVDSILASDPLYRSLTPSQRAQERYGLFASYGSQGGTSGLPESLRPFYANILLDKPGATKPAKPFASTNLGIALNTLNPVSLFKAAGKVGMSLIQAGGSTAAAIAPSVVQLFNPKAQGAPLMPFMQRVLGEPTQESFQEMAGHAAANEPYPAEGLLGSLANPLAKKLATSPFAHKLGLDKAAPLLAVGSVIGDSFLNLGGFGDLAGDAKLVEAIAKETDAGTIGSMLRRNGVAPEVADKVAPHLAAMKDPKEVADALKVTGAVQHTVDTTHALHPDIMDSARTEDVHPAAAADWEATYADRYAQLDEEVAKLKAEAKGSVVAEREVAPKIKALNDEGAAMEKDFIEKWQAPRTNGGMRPPAPHVPQPPKTDFARNDTVRLTDKATGQSQERIVHGVLPDGSGLLVADKVSGIPYKATFNKWQVEKTAQGDAKASLPGAGITFGELGQRESLEERGIDITNMSREEIAAKAAELKKSTQEAGTLPPEGSATEMPSRTTSSVIEGTGTHSESSQRQPLRRPDEAVSTRKTDSWYSKNSTFDSPAAIHIYATRRIENSQAALGDFAAGLKAIAPDAVAEVKSEESLVSKIEANIKDGIDPEKIPDVLRGRILTSPEGVAATYRTVTEHFTVIHARDFFNDPNPETGYKGLHVIVEPKPGLKAEIQIHTPDSLAAAKEARSHFEKWRRIDPKTLSPEEAAARDADYAASRAIFEKLPTVETNVPPRASFGGTTPEAPAKTQEVAQAPPPDDPVITTSEDDSLSLAAQQHEEWAYALRGDPAQETARNLESIFADLKGVSLDDLGKTLTHEDLENAKTEVQIGEDVLLDHPGRALMKYVSRQTGDLPEMSKFTANKNASRSKFAKEGDTLVQNLIGQDASGSGDLVRSQELVDEYRAIKSRVDAAKATFTRIRKTIAAQKKAGTFVENAKRTLAREVAKDTEALRNMLKSAERAGYERGKAEGVAKGEKMVADMTSRLKARRERIESLQQEYRLPDRQMRAIMGKADPRFMKADAFESWYTKLADRAMKARTSLDRYGALPTAGEDLMGVGGTTGDGEWQGLIRNWYQNQGTKAKVNLADYLGTPEFVLERLGMGETAEKLHDAQDAYVKTRDLELKKVMDWKAKAGNRPEANTRIFRWLDGQERFVVHEMTPNELAVAHDVRDYFKEWAERLNLPEDNRIAKYITHLFEPGPHENGADIFDDPELAALMTKKVAGSVYDPFLEARLGKRGYREDTWAALDAYVKRATRKEAFDPVLSEMVEKSKGLDQSVYNYVARLSHGINMRPTETDKLIDNLITHSMKISRFTERPTAYLSNKVRQGFYRGTIGLNFSSALRNLSQGANTYAKLGETYTTVGYAKIAWHLAKGDMSELRDSGVLGDDYIQDRKVGVYKTFLQKLDPALYYVFETAEKINRGAAFYGAKAKAAAKGLSEEEATRYAKRIVRETQFAFTRVDTPVALNNDLGKVVAQLQTYNIKQLEFLGRMARNHEWAGLVRFTGATLAFVYSIGKLFGMQLNQVIPSVSLTGSPFGSGLSAIYDVATGSATNPADQAKQQRNLRNLLLSRVPAGIQLQKTISGLETVDAGKDVTPKGRTRFTVPQDFGHYLQAGLFGKSSLPEAQAYYDSLNNKTSTPAYQAPPPL